MKNLLSYSLFSFLIIFGVTSCQDTVLLTKKQFSGVVQKGPFINGSTVTIFELDNNLNQTGRSYTTSIADNSGKFEIDNLELVSNYVLLKADGFYFNEVSGSLSSSQLTMFAIVDIKDINSANINVLTHLEKPRVEYLVQNQGKSFAEAKKQAQTEVLQIFNMEMTVDSTSEKLNFINTGVNNAMLLAISAILQGSSSTADMSLLMADIITDIKTDGVLDNVSLGSALLDNARLTDMVQIRQNLLEKYAELGLSEISISNFEDYVTAFIENTAFEPEKQITYPTNGQFGQNLLNDSVTVFNPANGYSLKANLPEGTSLKIVLKGKSGSWFYAVAPAPENWTVNRYDATTSSQIFTVTNAVENNDCHIILSDSTDSITVEYYENNASTPMRTKTLYSIHYNPSGYSFFQYPEMGEKTIYYNILNDSIKTTIPGKVYSMYSLVPLNKNLKVVLKCGQKGWVENPNKAGTNWNMMDYNSSTQSQEFYTTESGKCEMSFAFTYFSKITVEIYENNAQYPTKVKYLNE